MKGDLTDIVTFVASIGAEPGGPDEDVAKAAINLLGDICCIFTSDIRTILKETPRKEWQKLVVYCQTHPELQESTRWGVGQIEQATI